MPPPGVSTLAQLVEETNLSVGVNQSYAYGHTVDTLLAGKRPHLVRTSGTQKQLMRMLAAQRFDFMLVNPTEIDALAAMASIPADTFHVMRLADLPKGNTRYLMFSKSTPPEIIERINEAIRKLTKHYS